MPIKNARLNPHIPSETYIFIESMDKSSVGNGWYLAQSMNCFSKQAFIDKNWVRIPGYRRAY